MSKQIKCTYGGIAIVDDEDYNKVCDFNWNDYNTYPRTFKRVDGVLIGETMHRFILEPKEGFIIDHINGNVLDNRKINLRYCKPNENGMNRKVGKNSTTGHKGVVWHKRDKKYQCSIKVNGQRVYLGYFDNIEDAAKAYNEASIKYHKEYGRLNKV